MARRKTTRLLANADCRLGLSQRRYGLWVGVVLAFASISAYAYMRQQPEPLAEDLARLSIQLNQENANLKQAVERAELDDRHEAATRAALEKQISDLSLQVKRLQDEVAFMRSQQKN